MAERGIIADRKPSEQEVEASVSVPDTRDCRALAVSLHGLASQLERQPPGRRHGKIRLDRERRAIVVELEGSQA